jgi:hypothetical protein
MRNLSHCPVLLVDDANINPDILVEGLKSEYELSPELKSERQIFNLG